MVRHIELTIDFDLTCWAESMEDFENDDMEMINECVADYIINSSDELLEHLTIKKIWYEEEDEQSSFYLCENEQTFAHSRPVHYENDFGNNPVNYSENQFLRNS